MSDVFLSYAREDIGHAELLVKVLEAEGWSVFWDRDIPVGLNWFDFIEEKIGGAGGVVVICSSAVKNSKFVKIEIQESIRIETPIFPVLIDDETPPMGVRHLQAVDLSAWNGGSDDDQLQKLISALSRIKNPRPKRRKTEEKSGPLTIIGVPSLSNQPSAEIVLEFWRKSILEGLVKNSGIANPEFDFMMVFWADLIYKCPLHFDRDMDFDNLFSAEPYVEAKPGVLKSYVDEFSDEGLHQPQSSVGNLVDQFRTSIAAELASRMNQNVEKCLSYLMYYYNLDREIRDRHGTMRVARSVLMDEVGHVLKALKGRRIMLLAHSTGSIVAYDVLRDLGRSDPSFDIDLFVTIGSPLGHLQVKVNIDRERRQYTNPGESPLRTPTIVSRGWHNYADRLDRIAFNTHLRDDYGANENGIQVEDSLVLNDYVGIDGARNPNKAYGYLRTPELSNLITTFVGSVI
ncbi:MAG: toll/interleukin-1 receptor domain-containing protein [Pseudomonadota bacterium]